MRDERTVLVKAARSAFKERGFTMWKLIGATVALCLLLLVGAFAAAQPAYALCPYDQDCLNNPYGAGSPYKPNGLINPYGEYGSRYSNKSWTNPYATDAP